MTATRRAAALAAMVGLSGCFLVGPDYQRPDAPVPAAYKEAWKPGPLEKGWAPIRPNDAMDRGQWWAIFHDPALDKLERQIDISNQNLKAAEASFRQAEALVTEARAGLFPVFTLNGSAQRARTSGSGIAATFGGGTGRIGNQFQTTVNGTWSPDFWGAVRRQIESDVASAQASAATLANARLSAQAALATAYMQLRVADELARLLSASVTAFAQALQIVTNQYKSGTTDQSAVDQARAQLEGTKAQLIAVGISRAQFEHAIAVLIGKPPAELSIAPDEMVVAVPLIPAELASALIERRPDVAAAERDMAAANARIGVDVAAFYPNVTLSGDYGVAAAMLNKLFTAPSRIWAIGSTVAQTIFDGGLNNARVEGDKAAYDLAVANYRQAVLTAFQQVEDELAAERILAQQAQASDAALAAARSAEKTINNQYLAGTQAYTAVIVAQTVALNDAVQTVNIRQSRLVAAVALIEALGGGWDSSQLPGQEKIESDQPLNFNPLPPTFPPAP